MDTKEFFSLVLPSEGYRCLGIPLGKGKGFKHFFYDTNEHTAQVATYLDGTKHATVYMACASFKTTSSRQGSNAQAARSFWLDVDCGEGKVYAKASEGAKAILQFVQELALPQPYLVKSGNGIHVYWPMDADMSPEAWLPVARNLKKACAAWGLAADPSRTSDIASVLRPVGTHHRKGEPKEVKLVLEGEISSLNIFRERVEQFLNDRHITLESEKVENLNSDLMGGTKPTEYPPSHANTIADKCAVINLIRQTKGNVDQPTWYYGLGVLAFTEEGEEICHEWSSGHPSYDADETQTNIDRVKKFAPTTCAKLGEHQPEACASCPMNGKISSPIVLGFEAQETPVVVEEAPSSSDEPPVQRHIIFPAGFRWAQWSGKPTLQYSYKDEEGNDAWAPFCDTLFYPVSRLAADEGYALEVEMVVRDGHKRRFPVDCSVIAEGGKSLASLLGKHEIVAHPKMKPQIDAYLARWLDHMRQTADEVSMYQQFGWHGKNFLVGNTLITPEGDRPVLLRGAAAQKSTALIPKGDLQAWRDVIHTAYNHPGQEAYQYMVLCGFASPLFAMFKQYGGVTVYAHSEGSGAGKTTAQRAALSIWGNWKQMQLADKKTTQNALWALFGAYQNLPMLYDELTTMPNHIVSDTLFAVSSGSPKERLAADGSLRTNSLGWSSIMLASGNNLLSEKASLNRANAEAEIARLFEFTVNRASVLSANEATELFPKILDNYGHAGIKFIRYVVENYDKVEAVLLQVQKAFNSEADIKQEERYWSALQAAVLTALQITRKLGVIDFEVAPIKAWILNELASNRAQLKDSISDPTEQFGRMLSDIWSGILVTEGEGDLRKNAPANVIQDPRNQMTGRAIKAMDANERNVLLINSSTIKEWCNKHLVSTKEMFKAVCDAGLCAKTQERYSLGKGTAQYAHVSAQVKCWVIDSDKLGLDLASGNIAQKFKIIGGGQNDQQLRDGTGSI